MTTDSGSASGLATSERVADGGPSLMSALVGLNHYLLGPGVRKAVSQEDANARPG